MSEACGRCERQIRRELEFVSGVSQLLLSGSDINTILGRATRRLCEHKAYQRGMIALFNRRAGSILIKEAYGVSREEQARGIYYPGEGIIGEVVESGRAIIVPCIREDSRFLNRTGMSEGLLDSSFLCIPIGTGDQMIGSLSVVKESSGADAPDLDGDVQILRILASMIALAAQLSRSREEERVQMDRERILDARGPQKRPPHMIGNAKSLQPVFQMMRKVASAGSTVLLLGESGVGKAMAAEALHYAGDRADKAFVKLNCASLPGDLIESELFGRETKPSSGGPDRRMGRLEQAMGGTLFLDEIGDIGPGVQAGLLRVLQEREFERIGGSETLKADVRIIAATNRNLEEKVREGEFREDLYYRLNVIPITIPPLRKRKTDILLLSDFFIGKHNRRNGKHVNRISTPAIDMLMAYHWPGNVRELENAIERAVILSDDQVVHGYHLPPSLQMADSRLGGGGRHGTLQQKLDGIEYETIVEALKSTRGNLSRAAEQLGLTNRMMGIRARKYGIDFKDFRRGFSPGQ